MDKYIEITGARTHNLKNITLRLPRGKITAVVGVGGAGKSSLVFDTIHAEGYLRYIESISPYVRQFLDKVEKPPLDRIDGLPPAIAFRQKKSVGTSRSIVAASLDILDYLRLLYARIADFDCPGCGEAVRAFTVDEILAELLQNPQYRCSLAICFRYRGDVAFLVNRGYYRHLENGEDRPVQRDVKGRTINVLLDRITIPADSDGAGLEDLRGRLFEALDKSIALGDGTVPVFYGDQGRRETRFSTELYCGRCDVRYAPPDRHLFSYNSPRGACPVCKGSGEADSGGPDSPAPCVVCGGTRLNPLALSFKIKGKTIGEFLELSIGEAAAFMEGLDPAAPGDRVSPEVPGEIRTRLDFLVRNGLHYISLNRGTHTLSRGEFQRINLAFILGSTLSDSLLVLDQPSSDLHPHDYEKLEDFFTRLKDNGNTLLVIEHNRDIVSLCDHVLELGPMAGEKGGEVIFCGDRDSFFATPTLTVRHFQREWGLKPGVADGGGRDWLNFCGVSARNLRGFDLRIPCRAFTLVTGVSGAGKSTLLRDEIYPRSRGRRWAGTVKAVKSVVFIDPGRGTGRGGRTVAGYLGLLAPLRDIFAGLKESRVHHLTPAHFSLTSALGRCGACKGKGGNRIEMQFLPPVTVRCDLCGGTGYNADILKIKYKNHTVRQVLDLGLDGLLEVAGGDLPEAPRRLLRVVVDNGLGYLAPGRLLATLSTGERQRVELVRHLAPGPRDTLFLIDEPSHGLHPHDIEMVKHLIDGLLSAGNTLVAADHHPALIAHADYLADLGPGGGNEGGKLLYQGNPGGVTRVPESKTGFYLKKNFKNT